MYDSLDNDFYFFERFYSKNIFARSHLSNFQSCQTLPKALEVLVVSATVKSLLKYLVLIIMCFMSCGCDWNSAVCLTDKFGNALHNGKDCIFEN